MNTKLFGWSNGQVMDTYENWRELLVDRCGDLRMLDMSLAYALQDEALTHGDDGMYEALQPLLGD